MHLEYRNVNEAFRGIVLAIDSRDIETTRKGSRVGEVIQIEEPVIVSYTHPRERVLFNPYRDANPFFHLYESLWMLAGRNDVAPLVYYSSNIGEIASDDGKTFNGAYGYRWRHSICSMGDKPVDGIVKWEPVCDQLEILIHHLANKPESRRAVLQMWNVEDDLLKLDTTKDVCCNTAAYFSLRPSRTSDLDPGRFDTPEQAMARAKELGWENDNPLRKSSDDRKWFLYRDVPTHKLDMTVTNRSNDLIWGMLGANVVHFSFLQEYIACALGVEVGVYNQFTNNLHAYIDRWKPKAWLADTEAYAEYPKASRIPLVQDRQTFDFEVAAFVDNHYGTHSPTLKYSEPIYQEPFLELVARPLCVAYEAYKAGEYERSLKVVSSVESMDWRIAGREWITRRLEKKGISVE